MNKDHNAFNAFRLQIGRVLQVLLMFTGVCTIGAFLKAVFLHFTECK